MLSDLGIGGRIHLSGGDVVFDTHVFNPSGVINIASADHLEIGSQALFSVHSYAQDFEGETRFGPAGVVSLTAAQNLTIAQLDSFDFGDASHGRHATSPYVKVRYAAGPGRGPATATIATQHGVVVTW